MRFLCDKEVLLQCREKPIIALIRNAQTINFFFFNDTAPPEIYPLPLPGSFPIRPASEIAQVAGIQPVALEQSGVGRRILVVAPGRRRAAELNPALRALGQLVRGRIDDAYFVSRSEEHTSELQSQSNLVCRLLLEK